MVWLRKIKMPKLVLAETTSLSPRPYECWNKMWEQNPLCCRVWQTNQADRDRGASGSACVLSLTHTQCGKVTLSAKQSLVRNHPGEAASVMGHKVLYIATYKPRTWDDPEFPTNLKRKASLHSSSSSPLLLLLFLQHFYSVGTDRITPSQRAAPTKQLAGAVTELLI